MKTDDTDLLVSAIDNFLYESPILPPNLWDPNTRIEPPSKLPSVHKRRLNQKMYLNNLSLLNAPFSPPPPPPSSNLDVTGGVVNNAYVFDADSVAVVGGNSHSRLPPYTESHAHFNRLFYSQNNLPYDKSMLHQYGMNYKQSLASSNHSNQGDYDDETILDNDFDSGCGASDKKPGGNGALSDSFVVSQKIELDSDDEEEIERRNNGLVRSGRYLLMFNQFW